MSTTSPPTPAAFTNPYPSSCSDEGVKFGGLVLSREDHELLWRLRNAKGTLTIVIATLLSRCCNELRRRGITDLMEREAFENFINNCKIVLPHELNHTYGQASKTAPAAPDRSTRRSNRKANAPNDDGRDSSRVDKVA